jgi:hypothetical protein
MFQATNLQRVQKFVSQRYNEDLKVEYMVPNEEGKIVGGEECYQPIDVTFSRVAPNFYNGNKDIKVILSCRGTPNKETHILGYQNDF